MRKFWLFSRLIHLRDDVARLWRAFFDPVTPLWLKACMLGVVAYLVSPFDLLPEFLPVLGIVDDLVLVPMAITWIASKLPAGAGAKTVNGTVRRRR